MLGNLVLLAALQLGPAQRCGWSTEPTSDLPPSIAAVAARLDSADVPHDALAGIRLWFRGCNAVAGREAARRLRAARQRQRSEPALQALLGIVLVRGPEVQIPGSRGVHVRPVYQLSNAERDGARLLAKVVEVHAWPEVAEELAAVGIASRHRATLSIAEPALRAAAGQGDARILGAHAQVLLALGRFEEAAVVAARAVQRGHLASGHTAGAARLLSAGDAAAARLYLAGLESADAAAIERYFDDLRPLLTEGELAAWAGVSEAARGRWLRAAWEWRAVASGTPIEWRLAEHQRRLSHALAAYRRLAYRGPRPDSALHRDAAAEPLPLDDRGLLYVRHGPPERVIHESKSYREAWAYRSLNGLRTVFELDKAGDWADYFVAQTIRCGGRTRSWGSSIGHLDIELAAHYFGCSTMRDAAFVNLRMLAQDAIRQTRFTAALRAETAFPQVERPIDALLHTYAFRGTGTTDVATVVALPGGELTAKDNGYALRMAVAAADPVTRAVSRRDTVLSFGAPAALGPDDQLLVVIPMDAAPARGSVLNVFLENPHDAREVGALGLVRDIPDFSGDSLAMSDIVLAERRDGPLPRGDVRLAPLPGHQALAGESIRLYVELYGASPGGLLTLEVGIAPALGRERGRLDVLRGRRDAAYLVFEESPATTAAGVTPILKDIGVQLAPGSYEMVVRILDHRSNRIASASTDLLVIGRQ